MVKNYTDKQLLDRVKSLESFKKIPDDYWLIFVRSANPISDRFDDKAYLYKGERFIMRGTCTTHAGKSILTGGFKRYNKEGTAVMKADEWNYNTHKYGLHRGKMPAFRQDKKIKYYRDGDCDEVAEELGKVYDNIIYMNIHGSTYHRGRDIVRSRIGSWSAGCLVFNDNLLYEKIISICKPQKNLSFALINEF